LDRGDPRECAESRVFGESLVDESRAGESHVDDLCIGESRVDSYDHFGGKTFKVLIGLGREFVRRDTLDTLDMELLFFLVDDGREESSGGLSFEGSCLESSSSTSFILCCT
jgi:hypothetical protein